MFYLPPTINTPPHSYEPHTNYWTRLSICKNFLQYPNDGSQNHSNATNVIHDIGSGEVIVLCVTSKDKSVEALMVESFEIY